MPATVEIVEFTDPVCPFAWSAEPTRRRLQWLFGEQLRWRPRMVGLHSSRAELLREGKTPEMFARGRARLARAHHMPMDTATRSHPVASLPACRAVVAVRRHRPEAERAMLRQLRVAYFAGRAIDEPPAIGAAARAAGLRPADVRRWMSEPATRAELRADLAAARDPSTAALALTHKLSRNGDEETDGWRYTCPSYELTGDLGRQSIPGFQPLAAYEVALANLAPDLRRRRAPRSVAEVLRHFDEPLASAEVAAVCEIELDEARQQLSRVATERPIGSDGLWSLRPRTRRGPGG